MNEIVIGIFVLIILIAAFLSGRKRLMTHAESDRTAKHSERELWAKKSIMTYGQVQQIREELIESMEEKLEDHPEQLNRLKEIINDWAEVKIQSFQERRSWIRRPDKTKQK